MTQIQHYTIIVYPALEGGFISEVPALPGCITQGETEEEAFLMAEEAIAGYLECLLQLKEQIPREHRKPNLRTTEFKIGSNVSKVSHAFA